MSHEPSTGGPAASAPERPVSPDRLRLLLDAVLPDAEETAGGDVAVADLARRVHLSPHHFSRQVRAGAAESPWELRRRVQLERAAWQLAHGASVTEAAFAAGYDSVEGFARSYRRAYDRRPSDPVPPGPAGFRLPAPNGLHFHPPSSMWWDGAAGRTATPDLMMLEHDLVDTARLLEYAAKAGADAMEEVLLPRHVVLGWDGLEESLAAVLDHQVWSKEVWAASLLGEDVPPRRPRDAETLQARHLEVAVTWRSLWEEIAREDRWGDVFVDALCDPPESFVVGSVLAHVLTYSAYRRQVARQLLRRVAPEVAVDDGDPILWWQERA